MSNFIKVLGIKLSIIFLLVDCSGGRGGPDKIPPGNVKDLSLVNVDYYGAEIMFTAPGDDIYSGKASKFELRYSTDQNFALVPEKYFGVLGTEVLETPEPPPAGQKVRVFVKNLEPKTKYFIGLRTYDEAMNFSDVSNIVEFTTKDVPGGSGEVVGRISISSEVLSSDGQKIYLIFPGLYTLEEVGETFKLTPIRTDIPPIQGARIVWDGEKFISLGGSVSNELIQSAIGIFPDGRMVIMENSGDIVPFGQNGFFGYGFMNHKILKIDDKTFAVLGGVKFLSPRVDIALEEGKVSKIGLEKIPIFRVEGNKMVWSILYTQATTYPFSVLDPAVFMAERGERRNIIIWGGNQSESAIVPSSRMTRLELSDSPVWNEYMPFSGMVLKTYNTCEAQSVIRIIKVKNLEKTPEDIREIDDPMSLNKGDRFIYQGKAVEVVEDFYLRRYFVIGRFRKEYSEFSGIYGIFSNGEREILSRIVPTIGKSNFVIPGISRACSAEYLKDKMYILHMGEIYIIKFRNYEISVEE